MKKMLLLIIAVSLMTSCHFNTRVAGKLRGIEGYLAERPDSALTELEEIREKELSRSRSKAKYALLYSMALDKNYIDTADDSLINIRTEEITHRLSLLSRMRLTMRNTSMTYFIKV